MTDTPGQDPAVRGTTAQASTDARVARDARDARDARAAWRRLGAAVVSRPNRAQVLLAVLLFGFGFAVATQAQQASTTGLAGLRQADLVRLLNDATQRRTRLERDQADLESRLQALTSDSTGAEAARAAAQERRDAYAILAGAAPAVGPGITMTISDPDGAFPVESVLDMVQELRDAGAEAIQINDVRVVGSTSFVAVREGLQIDGEVVLPPLRVTAIGDPTTMATAMRIPGGVVDKVGATQGADIVVTPQDRVVIDAVRVVDEPVFATPDPGPSD